MQRPEALLGATISDHLLAQGADDDVVVIDAGVSRTYGELRGAAARLVGELVGLGLGPGDPVGLLGTNSFFWMAGYLAAMKLGIAVPLSEKLGPEELASQLEFVGCSAALVDRRQYRRNHEAFANLPVVTDEALGVEGPTAWPEGRVDEGADAAWMFTSGTTSRPKVVRLTHANLFANTESIISYLDLVSSDRMLVILPFHYVFGASLLHTHLAVGGSLVLCNTFTFPETALDLVDRHACTGMAGVPSSFQLLLKASSYSTRALPSLRLVQQAGGRLAPALIQELRSAQPGTEVFVMYGQTEATARLSYLPPGELDANLGSIGRGIPGVELTVETADGTPVAPGQQGEIVARGANISPGYLNDPEATAAKFRDGALRTGDLATVDAQGFIHIVGRSGDFIKSWGHRISPLQIEETALQHEDVAGAVAMGFPDPDAGEAVTLAVTAVPGAEIDPLAVRVFLAERLPKHMVPHSIHALKEMPLTGSGKVAREALRTLLANIDR